jgi:hypothetical protein
MVRCRGPTRDETKQARATDQNNKTMEDESDLPESRVLVKRSTLTRSSASPAVVVWSFFLTMVSGGLGRGRGVLWCWGVPGAGGGGVRERRARVLGGRGEETAAVLGGWRGGWLAKSPRKDGRGCAAFGCLWHTSQRVRQTHARGLAGTRAETAGCLQRTSALVFGAAHLCFIYPVGLLHAAARRGPSSRALTP